MLPYPENLSQVILTDLMKEKEEEKEKEKMGDFFVVVLFYDKMCLNYNRVLFEWLIQIDVK